MPKKNESLESLFESKKAEPTTEKAEEKKEEKKAPKEDVLPKQEETKAKEPKKEKKGSSRLSAGNLLAIGASLLFSFLLIFVGLCLDADGSYMNKSNAFAKLAEAMFGKLYSAPVNALIGDFFLAIYVSVFVIAVIYEYRIANSGKKEAPKGKLVLAYAITFIACLLLSLGLSFLIQEPKSVENLSNFGWYLLECLSVSIIIYLIAALIVGGALLLIVSIVRLAGSASAPRSEDEIIPSASGDSNELTKVLGAIDENVGGETISASAVAAPIVEELSDREKVFPALSTIDIQYGAEIFDEEKTKSDVKLASFVESFHDYLAKEEGLYYDIDTLRFFITGLGVSHLSILEGLSGTGKSSLPRSFAKFIGGESVFLPVQAIWRDKSSLIGYFNDFSKTYTETECLRKLYEANYNPNKIYIFVLDELNISRIEYYFADFLSILEYPKDEWKIRIMQLPFGFEPPAQLPGGMLKIGQNCYFVGTANQDESTFSIADKVYDRAISISFDKKNEPFKPKGEGKPVELSEKALEKLFNEAKANPKNQLGEKDKENFLAITDYLYEEFGLAFGNRILKQIEDMIPLFVEAGGSREDILDFMLERKVLSKLEGRFEDNIPTGLRKAKAMIEERYGQSFKRSLKEIDSLLKRL